MLHEDKRRFMRMMVDAQAQLTILDSNTKLTGTCRDISATGLSIVTEDTIEIDTMLIVFIKSHTESIPDLNAETKVVRVSQEDDGSNVIGLEILNFN